MPGNHKIFLDTSVIFAAVLSETGGARQLFQLGEAQVIQLIVGPNVLRECEQVVRRKAPASLPILATLLEIGMVVIAAKPTQACLEKARAVVAYEPDAYVLAEAIGAEPDWFLTHDKTHFLGTQAGSNLDFNIGTPGDHRQFLAGEFSQL